LHDDSFKRVRIGVGNNTQIPLDQYVLGQFTQDQMITLQKSIKFSTEICEQFIQNIPFTDIMTKYNTQT